MNLSTQARPAPRTSDQAGTAPPVKTSDAGAYEQLLLRRIILRVCAAQEDSAGHLPLPLDDLVRAMRRRCGIRELEHMLIGLTGLYGCREEIQAGDIGLDVLAPSPVLDRPAAPALALLLSRLVLLPDLQPALAALVRDLQGGGTEEQINDIAIQIGALLNRQRSMLQAEQAKMAGLLQVMSSRLDEIARHLSHEDSQRQAANDDSTDLDARLQGEVRDFGTQVQQAASLADVQQQVTSRIAQIGEHLQRFRERELVRLTDYKERAEKLRSRVSELEHETSQLQESVQREHEKATTDILTGIPNRLAFEQRLGEELKLSTQSASPLCIAIWDIDRFKSINDGYGHPAGDKVLRIVAQQLSRNMRKTDFLARFGGEEFVAIHRGINVQDALLQADRVRESLGQLGLHFNGKAVAITASCGISAFAADDTLEAVMNRADGALYRAKAAGRDRCMVGT